MAKPLPILIAILTAVNLSYSKEPGRVQPWAENPFYLAWGDTPVFPLGPTGYHAWTPISRPGTVDSHEQLYRLSRVIREIGSPHVVGFVRCLPYDPNNHMHDGEVVRVLQPWVRMEDGRYDLRRFEPQWEKRLKGYLDLALELRIVVSLEIWDDWSVSRGIGGAWNPGPRGAWNAHPFNPRNNINYDEKVLPDTTSACNAPFYSTIPSKSNIAEVLGLQKKYVDHLLDLVCDYPNIIINISNESRADLEWSRFWATYIRQRHSTIRQRHSTIRQRHSTVMIGEMPSTNRVDGGGQCDYLLNPTTLSTDPHYDYVDISQAVSGHEFGGNARRQALEGSRRISEYRAAMKNAGTERPLIVSKDYTRDSLGGAIVLWSRFVGGAASARFHRPSSNHPPSVIDFQHETAGHLGRFIARVPFWTMHPATGIIDALPAGAGGNVLTDSHSHYVIQLIGGNPGEKMVMKMPSGKWTIRWMDPASGAEFFNRQVRVDADSLELEIRGDLRHRILFMQRGIPVILDTDMESDVDDVGALAMMHALADRGETDLLGVMVCAVNPWSTLCADRINTYFNRGDLPLGQLKRPGVDRESQYARQVAEEFPGTLQSAGDAPDAVDQYREILASQPDNSVVLLSIGYLTNLRDLIISGPDKHSDLGGRELIEQKVRLWVCMGGQFPEGREANIRWDTGASIETIDDWPTEIIFSGWEIGLMDTGGQIPGLPVPNPVRRAYELFGRIPHKSWDQVAGLYAVRGLNEGSAGRYWELSEPGRLVIDGADGTNTWKEDSEGTHRYLIQMGADGDIAREIDELMMQLTTDAGILISSDFEGANAGDWSVDESTYPIEVRVGPGSSEHIWYFRISGVRDKTIRFVTDLNRFMRGDKLKGGIAYSYDNKQWMNVNNQDDGTQVIRFTGDVAYLSLQPIVTNTTLEQWYQDLPNLEHIQRRHLGITDGQPGELYWDREPLPIEPKAYDHGFPLWLYTISDTSKPQEPKRNILIMARECGWETQSTIGSLAIMKWLLSEDPLARRAREMAVWYFIPIANVDCAAAGLETSMKLTWFNPYDPEYVSPYEEVGFIKDFIIEEFDGGRKLDFAVRWHAFFQYATHIMKHQRSDRGNAIVQEEFDAIGAKLTINNYGIDRSQGKYRFDRWLRDELKLDIPLLTIEAGQYNTERDFEARRWITLEDLKLHGVAFGRYIARLLEMDSPASPHSPSK